MRTHLQFKSLAFPIVPGEDDEVNPEIYGLRLAEFVTAELDKQGFVAEHIAEDWGRCVLIGDAPFESFVGCSSLDENEWLIQICPHKPFVRKWFKKIDTTDWVERLATLVETALVERGGATDLRWWSDKESGRK